MEKKTRVVIYGGSLNMAGVAASLRTEPGLEIICVDPGAPDARQRLDELAPGVIAFDASDTHTGLDVTLLRERPGVLLIGVDPGSDHVLILSGRSRQALSAADLVGVINHERRGDTATG